MERTSVRDMIEGRKLTKKYEDTLQLNGALAQLGERLLCTQEVSGSIPLGSTINRPEES